MFWGEFARAEEGNNSMSLVGRRRRGDLNIGFVSSQPVEPGSGPGELHQLLSQNGRSAMFTVRVL